MTEDEVIEIVENAIDNLKSELQRGIERLDHRVSELERKVSYDLASDSDLRSLKHELNSLESTVRQLEYRR